MAFSGTVKEDHAGGGGGPGWMRAVVWRGDGGHRVPAKGLC